MAKPNYQYEKRQRELEKKKKREDKALKKTSPSDNGPQHGTPAQADADAPAEQEAAPPAP